MFILGALPPLNGLFFLDGNPAKRHMRDMDADTVNLIVNYAVRAIGALIGLWISFRIASRVEGVVRTNLEKRDFDRALTLFFASFARWLLLLAAVLACLSIVGVETASFAVILGSAGLAIGLAFQGTLSNFASGVLLLTFRPFKIGDYVDVGGQAGTVAEIGLFVTTLDTVSNTRVILGNSVVASSTITNYTHHDFRRVDIDVGVSYDADLRQARDVLNEAATSVPGRHEERGHQVILLKLGGSSIDFQVRIWCATSDYWSVWDKATQIIKEALDQNDVSIPFPQLDLHIKEAPKA